MFSPIPLPPFPWPAAVGLAVTQVNAGKCREAVELLDLILAAHPSNVGAYAARGTARALLGRLQGEHKLAPPRHDLPAKQPAGLLVPLCACTFKCLFSSMCGVYCCIAYRL